MSDSFPNKKVNDSSDLHLFFATSTDLGSDKIDFSNGRPKSLKHLLSDKTCTRTLRFYLYLHFNLIYVIMQ